MSDAVNTILRMMGLGRPDPPQYPGPHEFPTGTTDADLYGTGREGFVNKQAPEHQQWARDAAVAAHRSSLASLGMEPGVMDTVPGMTDDEYLIGHYDKKGDRIRVDPQDRSVPIHEAIHRGMRMVGERYPEEYGRALFRNYAPSNEVLVRAMMQRMYGDIEQETPRRYGVEVDPEDADAAAFKDSAEMDRIVEILEQLGARMVKERRPGGPR